MFPAVLPERFRSILLKRLPVLSWLPRYNLEYAISDAVAGVTVGLTIIPQAIAYASLAGMPPQYGLYSAISGGFVYIILGTCKDVSIGLTALLALLTSTYTRNTNPDMAVLLCFLSGCIELLCGVLQVGFLVDFISVPVVNGFTSAAAIIIASSQLKGILGIRFQSDGFIDTWRQLGTNIWRARLWDMVLGVCCIVTLLSLRKLKDVKPSSSEDGKPPSGRTKVLEKLAWFMSTARNGMVVVICAAIAVVFHGKDQEPFILTGVIDPGLPPFGPPPFSTSFGNTTYTFVDMCRYMGSGIAVVPIISILGNVAIAKAFSSGMVVDATQEMIALGVCNILGSFLRSMPVNGSFSCSAVNNASGVRTQLGAMYTGIIVILALSLLTPYFYFIPQATLSAVIICAVLFMVDVEILGPIWRYSRLDLVPLLSTFITSLWLGVEVGIVVGVVVDLVFLLYFTARPKVTVEKVTSGSDPEYMLVTPSTGLQFPAVDFIREVVTKASLPEEERARQLPIVVDCRHIHRADYTAAQGLQALIRDFRQSERHVILHNLKPTVFSTLGGVCSSDLTYSNTHEELMDTLRGLHTGAEVSQL
ncbi:sodium-independent sulfate anion transporter [Anabrus simplex]|uniref:sodium-independent sulfate anion transporter n=1 Tax=Anabrus simplex TaxID=316456 RepID=UPI0035A3B183